MKRSVMLGLAFLLMAAGVLTIVTAATLRNREPVAVVSKAETTPSTSASANQSPDWLTEYTLTERSGREFDSAELDGKVHVVNFFFSSCPSTCRMQSTKVQQLARKFGPEGVVFLSITCDPDHDTPGTLQEYARMYNADPEHWLFLTSDDLNYLRRVGSEVYQLPVDKQTHSEDLVVVDKWGEIRGRFHWNEPPEVLELKEMLESLLAEEHPPEDEAAQTGPEGAEKIDA